ncbi:hypothetical protein [Georgenia faecalis]|uniref:hypothetical protein n=1 Tax=Georgenia faecalis TaxID=2483799 RepID=UPI000FDB79A5|nr:hypothetical protein [Georgenia faecalis]
MAGPTRGGAGGDDPGRDDIDAQWADLTARLGELRLPPPADGEDEPAAPPARTAPDLGPRDYVPGDPGPDDEDDDPGRDLVDGFSPPDPDPISGAHPVVAVGWSAVVTGLALLFVCAIVWRTAPTLVWIGAVAALVGGVGLLLWHMPAHRDPDDYDDGAVV